MTKVEQFLSDNYNGFFDEFDITELQEILQAMQKYADEQLLIQRVGNLKLIVMKTRNEIINELFGLTVDAPDTTPIDKGKCKYAMKFYLEHYKEQLNKILNEDKTRSFSGEK